MSKPAGEQLVARIVEWALGKKAEDLAVMDLRGIMDVTDFFVVATGASSLQVQAICDAVDAGASAAGVPPSHIEGRDGGRWALIDFIDVVVHIMLPDVRRFYGLERLWGDAIIVRYDELGRPIKFPPQDASDAVRP